MELNSTWKQTFDKIFGFIAEALIASGLRIFLLYFAK
jgi:hypothetical protein